MAEGFDSYTFDKGLNLRKNPTVVGDGELLTCSGFSLDQDGYLVPMKPREAIDHAALGNIRNIHRSMNWLIVADGSNIRYKWDLRKYCDRYIPPDDEFTLCGEGYDGRHRVVDYKGFTFFVNGHANRCFNRGNLYKWGIDNPFAKPSGTAGAGGYPSGTYELYYTYLIKFPNGEEYETAPSPNGTVTVAGQKIEWSNIGICPYSGEGVVIYRCLYRWSSGLGDIYYVTSISDNTTETYSDNFADTAINTNSILATDEYAPPTEGFVDLEFYLQRIFAIKGTYLFWSEPYLPFMFKTTSSINFANEGHDLTAIVYWGDQLYIATKSNWFRLNGTDPDTWGKKETYADIGIDATDTVKKNKFGIVGKNYDGIYLFDGSTAKNITEKKLGRDMFMAITDPSACWAEWDGSKYYFYYPSTGSTVDSCLVCDFTYYPEVRFYHDPSILSAHEFNGPTKIRYMAKSTGITYEESTSGDAVDLSVKTGDKFGTSLLKRKQIKYIFHDMNTHGKDVTLTLYVDGTAVSPTRTINTTTRGVRRIEDVGIWEGYRFEVGLTCDDVTDDELEIYAPIAIGWTSVGG